MRWLWSGSLFLSVVLVVSVLVLSPAGAGLTVADTVRVSVDSAGAQANGDSSHPAICDDGSSVVYSSAASNLVSGDTNGVSDIFAYDVATGVTTRVSVDSHGNQAMPHPGWPSGGSVLPAISGDCGTIAYVSYTANLVSDDTNDIGDIFAYDVATGVTTRVSVDSHGNQAVGVGNTYTMDPAVSYDGGTIVYWSGANNLVAGDTNNAVDVFAYDVATQVTKRVSVDSDGNQAEPYLSSRPAVSGDGDTVVFVSASPNLVPGDAHATTDVFAHELATGVTTRVSIDGTDNSSLTEGFPAISYDGDLIVYQSGLTGFGPDDTNNARDILAYDATTGVTTNVSVDSDGNQANSSSFQSAVSSDGTTVVFLSAATNLVPDDGGGNLFAYMVGSGAVSRVGSGADPAISGDGTILVYRANGEDLVPGDTNGEDDIFLTRLVNDAGSFDDDDGSVFESDIEWLAREGITKGCGPRRFCPSGNVTRGQMAAFLSRALDLPAATQDYFTDDETSIFEDSINRLAASGITKGCGATTFCPTDPVTRGQMAAFLVRALGYADSGGGDLFEDDDTSIFEADIDRLATAGVTRGCNPPANSRFCPDGYVTRGQMAAFLHRALGTT